MQIPIPHKFTKAVLFACDAENIGKAVEQAAASGADLDGADLTCANLRGADLDGADLTCANLRGANLRGANLRGANLDGETLLIAPISIANLTLPVLITQKYLRIGCQRHSHEEWASFKENDIRDMPPLAFKFWFGAWRIPLLQMCEAYRNECEAQSRKD